MARSPLMA
ncbi:hypothetical protein D021_3731A, partial [Vibrio parahaemolyticus 10296]